MTLSDDLIVSVNCYVPFSFPLKVLQEIAFPELLLNSLMGTFFSSSYLYRLYSYSGSSHSLTVTVNITVSASGLLLLPCLQVA